MRNIKLQIAQAWDKFALYYAEEARHLDEIMRKVQREHIDSFESVHQTILKGSDERRCMVGCFENTQLKQAVGAAWPVLEKTHCAPKMVLFDKSDLPDLQPAQSQSCSRTDQLSES